MKQNDLLKILYTLKLQMEDLGKQVWNASFLLEFITEKMNKAAASGNIADLSISLEEYQAYYEKRIEELQNEQEEALKEQLVESTGINLDE